MAPDADPAPKSRPERAGEEPLLTLRGVGKKYATPVLQEIDLAIHCGEVHALMGANGAGKSTLARIIAGLVRADSGSMTLLGNPYRPRGVNEAETGGVRMVQQELTLIPTLSIAENLYLNRLPAWCGLIRGGLLRERARSALAAVGLEHLDASIPAGRLGVGEQQLVEIARALAGSCRILILDEPTAALSGPQVERLVGRIVALRASGVAIIYISHRLDEVRRIADRITVLRDGRLVATRPSGELDLDEAVRLMVGMNPERVLRPHARDVGPEVLRVEGLCRGERVRDVSLSLSQGEVLGLSGLIGAGRTELLRAIFGADRADSGTIRIEGLKSIRPFRHPREAVRSGIGMVPEDRKSEGLLAPLSVRTNVTLGRISRFRNRLGWIDRKAEAVTGEAVGRDVDLRCRSDRQPVRELSGGNQQKVVVGRWLLREPRILLLDEPTRGIDVAAKFAIYRLIDALASRGKGILVASSDVEELMLLCDRIAVMSAGRVVQVFERGTWTHEALLAAALVGMTRTRHGTEAGP